MSKKGNVTAIIDADASGLKKEMEKMRSQMARFTRDTNKNMNSFNKSMNKGASMKGMIGGLAKMAGGAIALSTALGMVKKGVASIADFEKQMSRLKAVTKASAEDTGALREQFLKLGRTTQFTSSEAASLGVELGKLGFTTSEIIDASEAVLSLAAATDTDLARAAEIAGSTLRAFGLQAVEMQRVVDVMALSFSSSALDAESFAEAMKYVAPVAAAAGVSVERTTAMLGKLADVGIKGSMAGTSLRRIFLAMVETGKPAAEAFKEVTEKGITLSGAQDEVGKTALTALNALSKMTDGVDGLAKSLENAEGSASKMSTTMQDNLFGDWTRFTSALDGWIQKGEGVVKVMRSIIKTATAALGGDIVQGDFSANVGDMGLDQAEGFLKVAKYLRSIAKESDEIQILDKRIEKLIKHINQMKSGDTSFGAPGAPTDFGNIVANAMDEKEAAKAKEAEEKRQEAIAKSREEYRKFHEEMMKFQADLKFTLWEQDIKATFDALAEAEAEAAREIDTLSDEFIGLNEALEQMETQLAEDPFTKVEEGAIRSRMAIQELREEISNNFNESLEQMQERAGEIGYNIGETIVNAHKREAEANKNAAKVAEETGRTVQEVQAENAKARKNAIREQLRANASMILSELVLSAVSALPFPFNLIAGGVAAAAGTALINTAIPALAEGGLVNKPTLSLIGEAGPEAVIPLSKMKEMGGGGVTVVFNSAVVGNEYEVGRKLKRILNEYETRV